LAPARSICLLHALSATKRSASLRRRVQVLWVDRLTPEEFARGFGSHTPMFSGQTKCVRYYMNCARGLKLFRAIVLDCGYVVDARDTRRDLTDAQRSAVEKARARPWSNVPCARVTC
jgi:hypothetical protein